MNSALSLLNTSITTLCALCPLQSHPVDNNGNNVLIAGSSENKNSEAIQWQMIIFHPFGGHLSAGTTLLAIVFLLLLLVGGAEFGELTRP